MRFVFEARYYNVSGECFVILFEYKSIQYAVNKFINHCIRFTKLKEHGFGYTVKQFEHEKECEHVEIEVFTDTKFENPETIAYKSFVF